jgi:hypothetical protein
MIWLALHWVAVAAVSGLTPAAHATGSDAAFRALIANEVHRWDRFLKRARLRLD